MADIELVIKIDEEAKIAFDNAESNDLKGCYYDHGGVIGNAIKNGIPLRKGHGRLVDADEMVKILRKSEYYQEKRGDFYGADVTSRVKNFIEDTETVIEAYTDEGVTTADDILNKIRTEIETEKNAGCHTQYAGGLDFALSIIDKYRAESEDEE